MQIFLKRAYDKASADDGYRLLVDRVWPRGLTRQSLALDAWIKELAPSNALRKWFSHEPRKWAQFKRRYFRELDAQPDEVDRLCDSIDGRRVTLVYSAKEERFNNAVALKEYLASRNEDQ